MRVPTLLILGGLALAACDDRMRVDPDLKIDTGTEANIEHPSYDPAQLTWLREGRVVVFQGRNWVPVGNTIDAPLVREVGEFEGMRLYTTAEQTPPYDRLLFPTTNGWQILQPAAGDTAGAAADSLAAPGTARGVRTVPPPADARPAPRDTTPR